MYMSFMTMNRFVEERAARDEAFRHDLERNRRPFLSHGRGMSDDELLAKLRQLGFDAHRHGLTDTFRNFVSAQAMSESMIAGAKTAPPDMEADWVWIATACLWERWQPDLPNMEILDDKMQAGYAALATGNTVEACRLWLETWRGILEITDRAEMDSLDEFDNHFGGTQSVFNWVQDFERELHNAGLDDPVFFRERVSLCEIMINRFSDGKLPIDDFKVALAVSHFELGDRQMSDRLFRVWLEESPQWEWGWIAWSDSYWLFTQAEAKDAARAEQILREGLACCDSEHRTNILDRLQLLYKETGNAQEAEAICEEIKQTQAAKPTTTARFAPQSMQIRKRIDFGEDGISETELPYLAPTVRPSQSTDGDSFGKHPRVRRNGPCPCGSGKKFKKCCARKRQ